MRYCRLVSSTPLNARRTAALGPLVVLILIAWLFGLYWLAAVEPLHCGDTGPVLSRCTDAEVRQSEARMFQFWALATGGPLLALGVWTFLAPQSRQFRAAFVVAAAWLLIVAPWMMNSAASLHTAEVILAEIASDWVGIRGWLIAEVAGRLALTVSAPFILSILLLRRGHWVYASAWIAVTVVAIATVRAILY